jgi:hypothetical protein
MSSGGILQNFTIIDADGNPVTVELRDGKFSLDIHDEESRRLLERIFTEGIPADQFTERPMRGRVVLYDASGSPIGTQPNPLLTSYPDVTVPSARLTALNDQLVVNCTGQTSVSFNIVSSSGTNTAQFALSPDGGITWVSATALQYFLGTPFLVTTVSGGSVGVFTVNTSGYNAARIFLNTFTSGVVTVNARGTVGSQGFVITGSLPIGLNKIGSVAPSWTDSAAPLAVTATGASGAAVTATLPAVASQFHYITEIQIVQYAAAGLTAGATPTVVTTTNLPGSLAFTFTTIGALGSTTIEQFEPTMPLKSSVVNTATTIVCPAIAGAIWRVNVFYRADA